MSDEKSDGPEPKVWKWGFVKAKSRDWTDEEVAAAVAHMKQTRPNEWAELEKIELTTGDLTDSRAADIEFGTLIHLHPECQFNEISELFAKVRLYRRSQLGVEKLSYIRFKH